MCIPQLNQTNIPQATQKASNRPTNPKGLGSSPLLERFRLATIQAQDLNAFRSIQVYKFRRYIHTFLIRLNE